nr:2-oxo acid dehydrogenase subunit E2 [Acidimicrobiia bacterium]
VLPEFPNVNASVDGDNLVVHHDFHVGIAVDLDHKGLLVPALRNADGKRMRLIAQEIRDLAVRARSKKLQPEEIMGSTFTITNPGPYGSFQTFPIINQPQVAILATDGVAKRPVVVSDEFGQDVIAIHHMGMLTLGWDHRAFDGGYTAQFLARLKEVLETRDWESEIV